MEDEKSARLSNVTEQSEWIYRMCKRILMLCISCAPLLHIIIFIQYILRYMNNIKIDLNSLEENYLFTWALAFESYMFLIILFVYIYSIYI